MLGKPIRVFKNSEGLTTLELHYKYSGYDKTLRIDYVIDNETHLYKVVKTIANGDYARVEGTHGRLLGGIDTRDLLLFSPISVERVRSDYEQLLLIEPMATLIQSGVYRMNF